MGTGRREWEEIREGTCWRGSLRPVDDVRFELNLTHYHVDAEYSQYTRDRADPRSTQSGTGLAAFPVVKDIASLKADDIPADIVEGFSSRFRTGSTGWAPLWILFLDLPLSKMMTCGSSPRSLAGRHISLPIRMRVRQHQSAQEAGVADTVDSLTGDGCVSGVCRVRVRCAGPVVYSCPSLPLHDETDPSVMVEEKS